MLDIDRVLVRSVSLITVADQTNGGVVAVLKQRSIDLKGGVAIRAAVSLQILRLDFLTVDVQHQLDCGGGVDVHVQTHLACACR